MTRFLPLLAEKFARQRLHALAITEGHHTDDKPIVLFLCTHNAGRSRMALGFFQDLTADTAVAGLFAAAVTSEPNPKTTSAPTSTGTRPRMSAMRPMSGSIAM